MFKQCKIEIHQKWLNPKEEEFQIKIDLSHHSNSFSNKNKL